jgi:RecA/RadA recombinase
VGGAERVGWLNSNSHSGPLNVLAQHLIRVVCRQTSPSGALTLDLALGGGYPKGRVVEIYGPESSGKTTLALHAMAEVQRRGGNVALIDAEHAFDPLFAKVGGRV